MYDSDEVRRIYQADPVYAKRQWYKLKSWTETVVGYLNEADQLTRCLLRNHNIMGREYTWDAGINIEVELSPTDHKMLWQRVTRRLRDNGVTGLWIREVSLSNLIHYHLCIKNEMNRAALEKAIDKSMSNRWGTKEAPYHKHVKTIGGQWGYLHYITKAKVEGCRNGDRSAKIVKDMWAGRRLLFKPNLPLKKFGTIGKFWERSKKQLWREIRAIEERISKGLEKPNIKRLSQHIKDLFGEDVRATDIERSLEYHADTLPVQEWMDRLFVKDHEESD